MTDMQSVIISGFGGQGILALGKMLAYTGMKMGLEVSWIPSYGPEMRGGTANCTVIISKKPIGSPVVAKPTVVIAMNKPSLDKFEDVVEKGGLLIVNSSLVDRKAKRTDIDVVEVPATDIASEMGNVRFANMVMTGAFLGRSPLLDMQVAQDALPEVISKRNHDMIGDNIKAMNKGRELSKKS